MRALASDNPFLVTGPDTAAGLVEVTARPGIRFTEQPGTTFDLASTITARQYTRRYGGYVTGRGDAVAEHRDSERLTYRAAAGFSRDLAVDVLTSAVESSVDPTRIRTTFLGAASVTYRPDERTWLIPEVNFERSRFSGDQLVANTRAVTGSMTYRRRTAPATTAGVRALVSFNKVGPLATMSTQSLYGTLDHRFSSAWPMTIELGLERVGARTEDVLGETATYPARVRLSGRAQLCRQIPSSTVCLGGSVDTEVSGLGGLQRRTVAHASVSQHLGERTTFSIDAEYQRAALQGANLPVFETVRATATLERRIQSDLRLGATVQYLRRRLIDGSHIGAGFAGLHVTWSPRAI